MELNPIRHSTNMKIETKKSQRCSLDDSFIPAEEGRKVCQRREEASGQKKHSSNSKVIKREKVS